MNIHDCLIKKNPGNLRVLYWRGEMERIIAYIQREASRWQAIF